MCLRSVEKRMGPFNLEPKFTLTVTCLGCQQALAAATGKPEGSYVMSCGFLQPIVVIVVPELREAVDRWS